MNKDLRYKFVTMVVQEQANKVIGSMENDVLDGHATEMPPRDEIEDTVYREVMDTGHVFIAGGLRPVQKDIRFLSTPAIKMLVNIIVEQTLEDS